MSKPRRHGPSPTPGPGFNRLARPLSLTAQVEQTLRHAIAEGRFPGGRLPTEVELAEQLGVSRETVRLAAGTLQREGLLVKIRRRGTFTRPPCVPDRLRAAEPTLLGYLQADYPTAQGQEEAVGRATSALMLQGAIEEAGQAGLRLVAQRAPYTGLRQAFEQLHRATPLRGVILASCGEEKLLKRISGLGLRAVLLDHDLPLPEIGSVRDDSFEGARQAVLYLASLGHRRVAFAQWHQTDLNPWRLRGYRQGLRDAGLPRRRRWEIPAELTEAGARHVVARWAALAPRPTALYCFNNTLARFLIQEMRRRGLRLPDDVSVMGGGGEDVPGLTCHQADWYRLGRMAVAALLRADAAHTSPEHLLVPHTLRAGQTTVPPGSARERAND